MATAPLFPKQLDSIVQTVTLSMNLNLSNATPPLTPNYYGVRCGWQSEGQPANKIDEDIVFVREVEVEDQYNKVRDVSYSLDAKTTNYTRIWEFFWSVYGPNSFDNARKIRSALFDQYIRSAFAQANLYCIPDPTAPRRFPEKRDGQWWERVDFSCRFNEWVTETYAPEFIESVEIQAYNQYDVELFDVTFSED
jgi:hypothetical protein